MGPEIFGLPKTGPKILGPKTVVKWSDFGCSINDLHKLPPNWVKFLVKKNGRGWQVRALMKML